MPKKLTTEQFIQKAKQVHGYKYDYSRVKYVNNKTKVEIICPQHGSFYQTPSNHLQQHGCPECRKQMLSEMFSDKLNGFVQKACQVHRNKYDYSFVEYVNNRTKVAISCPKHDVFWQLPNSHLLGNGCPECAKERRRLSEKEFIERAQEVHGNKYEYSKVEYINSKRKVEIVCPKHGSFFQAPINHLFGNGCPKCVHRVSRGEQELADALKARGIRVIQSYRRWCPERPKLEIDIYLPEHQVGIEYNGEYWHREPDREKEKIRMALEQGIRIITVWESEWKENRENVLKMIAEIVKILI